MENQNSAQLDQSIVPIAVFDFDGTSINGQSGLLLARYLFMRLYFGPLKTLRLAWWGLRYKFHLPIREAEARELIFGSLSKRPAQEVKQLLSDFHDQVLIKRYRKQAIEEIRACQKEGIVCLLVSATFSDIAQKAADYLGLDGLVATQMETNEEGNFTGFVDGEVIAGPEKTRALERWADEHIGRFKWKLVAAYGDHYSDADILDTAVFAYAVSPGRSLRQTAKRRDWHILDWD